MKPVPQMPAMGQQAEGHEQAVWSNSTMQQKKVSQSVPDTTPLSKEEKRSLGQRIRSLNPKYLKGIVKIVHPDQKLVSSTLKFDINKLPPHISRELSKYVDQ
mmetsp:Transcript_29964/g.34340  ORF Transcript_29964/g.34340 Transcript_29964/m.34340 type:complete len:102 (+) Transcript_29964:585-890(+)